MQDATSLVRNIWKNTLEVVKIDDNDHFFVLGGDSLLGSIVVLTIVEIICSEITLLDLYENPTFNEFADLVNQKRVISCQLLNCDMTLQHNYAKYLA